MHSLSSVRKDPEAGAAHSRPLPITLPDLGLIPKPFSSGPFNVKCWNAPPPPRITVLWISAPGCVCFSGFFGLSFSSNLFFPSLSLLFEIPSRQAVIHLESSLFLKAFICVCLISWTLTLQLKLETCRSRPDAWISWSNSLEIAQVYW